MSMTLTPDQIKKHAKATTANLKLKAQKVFNAWIRKRDEGKPCISCGKFTVLQAGHFYSAGSHNHLRFTPENCHGQCMRCNYYLSGNLNEYRKNLIERIGEENVERLDKLAKQRGNHKTDRFYLIEVILTYK